MSDILLVGKELPDCLFLAEGLTKNNRKVFSITNEPAISSNYEDEGIFTTNWNKGSAVSSRSLLIKAETVLPEINEYLIFFDTYYFAPKYDSDRSEMVAQAIDTMISGYQYFVNELLYRLEQRKEKASVAFLIKSYPSKYETFQNSNKLNFHPTSTIVSAAQSAFISLAENTAILAGERDYLSVLLAKCEPNNELFTRERDLGQWVAQSLDTLEGLKNKQSTKQSATWIKAGAKISSGFSLFK
ncbi:MAG: hypothetical protein MJ188_02705 [Treponema sp.]|nr:hypothetical protein [Treponema sp.]